MPPISHLGFECGIYLLLGYALLTARRQGGPALGYLLGGSAFGVSLEAVNVLSGMGYSYGRFLVMLGPVPLCIGLGWGVIMYAARLASDASGLPVWARPAGDALLALNIDLSMDAVAYRLGLWHWAWGPGQDPLRSEWFGVPFANLYGWLCVVGLYSAIARGLERWPGRSRRSALAALARPCLAAGLAEGLLLPLLQVPRLIPIPAHWLLALGGVLAGCGAVVLWGRHQRRAYVQAPALAWVVPTAFHVYFLVWLFGAGFYQQTLWLPIMALGNGLVGAVVHAPRATGMATWADQGPAEGARPSNPRARKDAGV